MKFAFFIDSTISFKFVEILLPIIATFVLLASTAWISRDCLYGSGWWVASEIEIEPG